MNQKTLNLFDYFLILGVSALSITHAFLSKEADLIGIVTGITGLINVVLVAKGSIYNYFFGLITVSLYAYISFKSEIYGDAALNFLYYLPMQFIGWFGWRKERREDSNSIIKSRIMNLKQRIILGIISAVLVIGTGFILKHLGDPQPFKDSATTVLSVLAMFLMVRAYAEQWILWIAVNIISIVMWVIIAIEGGEHAELMIIMWVFYLLNSINGLRVWVTQLNR